MWEVEEYVRRRCKEENVLPLQIGVEGSIMDYPYATCCGLNDEVAHAFPRHYILKDGDLLKVDMVLSEPIDKCQNWILTMLLRLKNTRNHILAVWLTHVGLMRLERHLTKLKNLWK